jgi:hypothetical protein
MTIRIALKEWITKNCHATKTDHLTKLTTKYKKWRKHEFENYQTNIESGDYTAFDSM